MDFAKAYVHLDWNFLWSAMRRGFPYELVELHYIPCLFSLEAGSSLRGGLSTDITTIRPSSGCTLYLHGPSFFSWLTEGLPNDKPPRGHPPTTVC